MRNVQATPPSVPPPTGAPHEDPHNLDEMLQEERILLQGAQVLTAFLVILPFQPGFAKLNLSERWIYLATFVCALSSLVLFAAPAAQHRLERPLRHRVRFKVSATQTIIAGLVPLSLALILVAKLVVDEAIGNHEGTIVATVVAVVLIALWWVLPLWRKRACA